MRYKRQAPFRHTFKEPISALFDINEIDGKLVETSKGIAEIIDISTEGLKLNSELHIPEIDRKSIRISISFVLNDTDLNFAGIIVWKKAKGTSYDYGIDLLTDEADKKNLVEQLKNHSKMAH